ncbi:MAG: hydratase [Proteobacteria bacterium]|nr:hydratase [Pseudomonadota bacterium]
MADRLLAACDAAEVVPLPSAADPAFGLAEAYGVADAIRARRIARGERPLGYKIGFTNRGIWSRYGVHAPIWGPVWDSTARFLDGHTAQVSLAPLVQPRLEPEVAFGFRSSPRAGMSEGELAGCLEWVAHAFEIVHTHYEGWRFAAADTVADFALHGRLYIGPRVPIDRYGTGLGAELATLRVELHRETGLVDRGVADIVLGGPLNALRLWVDEMAAQSPMWRVAPGDVVTTGTITDAWPLAPGQHWHTRLSDARLTALHLHTEA